jgi:DNA-binding CsgD family transcriptional regulator
VILFDYDGKILLMNHSAESVLKQHDGLTCARGEVHAGLAHETLKLRQLIKSAVQLVVSPFSSGGGAIGISRPSRKRPFQLFVAPASSNPMSLPTARGAAALFIHDPEATQNSSEDLLRSFYGLTVAEAATAALLMKGKDLKEIANELHVTRETSRMHLKHVFEKTGTRRQSELVNVLLRSPAILRRTA